MPRSGCELADETFQQRRLADAVRADDGDAFAHFDHQVEVLEQRRVVAFGQAFEFERQPIQLLVLVEADVRADAAARLHLFEFDLLELTGARCRLSRLRGIGREAADERLQVGDLRLLLRVVQQHALAHLRRRGHVLIVVAGIDAQFAVVEVGHVRADAVQEVAIVRDDHHRAVAFVEHAFEPADRVDVEVVGRFVEQQHVRVAEQCLREQYAQLPAGRDAAHQSFVLFERNADTEQQFAGARFGGVAVEFREFDFEVGNLHAVVFAHLRQRVDPVALLLHAPQVRVTHDHGVEHAEIFERELILAQLAEANVRLDRHVARGRRHVAAEDLHERRFAGAVRADQAIAIAVAELDRDVFEQWLRAELNREVGGGNHRRSIRKVGGVSPISVEIRAQGRESGRPFITFERPTPIESRSACGGGRLDERGDQARR